MALQRVFCFHDQAAKAYMNPWVMPSKGLAERQMVDLVNNKETTMSQHPADYTLFEIGTWDELTATYVPHDSKISLGCAFDFIK